MDPAFFVFFVLLRFDHTYHYPLDIHHFIYSSTSSVSASAAGFLKRTDRSERVTMALKKQLMGGNYG